MSALLVLAAVAAALWLFHGGLETVERVRAAGEYVRSWGSALAGGAVAVFVIVYVAPHWHAVGGR